MTEKAIHNFLLNISDNVSKELTVVSREESKYKHLLHISTDTKIPAFVPRICDRQLDGEDRTVPRVVVAPSLYGCILGYQVLPHDYLHAEHEAEHNDSSWKNGYMIYALPYEHCLVPTEKLVPNTGPSGEAWLVNYTPETKTYEPLDAGRMFATEIRHVPRPGERPVCEAVIYLEARLEEGLQISENLSVKKGYWCIELPVQDNESWENLSWKEDGEVTIKEISKGEYFAQKRAVADLLSHSEPPSPTPAFLNW